MPRFSPESSVSQRGRTLIRTASPSQTSL